ncbi:MAG: HupE/UreJ family protein [Nitrospiraceae bacterium]
MVRRVAMIVVQVLWICTWGLLALAHKPSDSYLTLSVETNRIDGRWDIALRDLDYAIGLDGDDDGQLTWGEVRSRLPVIHDYVFSRLALSMGEAACASRPTADLMDRHTDGTYAVLKFSLDCPHPTLQMDVRYNLLFDLDPQHRGLAQIVSREGVTGVIFSPEHAQQTVLVGASRPWGTFLSYAHEGVHHIWSGIDHLLFLMALLLPSVLRRRDGVWEAVPAFRPALIQTAAVVTAFTVAHSITLTLAALDLVRLPARLVESAIAASVVLAALNNILPLVSERRWAVALGFGLLHGFGFAGALADLGLPPNATVAALAGFNLGVEAGQLLIVVLFLPIAYGFRRVRIYQCGVVAAGSCAIAALALCWLIERAFDVGLLPS